MWEWLKNLLMDDRFMPHVHCLADIPSLTRLHVISDAAIGLSYVFISATLAYLVYRGRREIPFHLMFIAFGIFIIACGCTHFMDIVTLWIPTYWLSGGVKAITAIASVATACALPPLVPTAIKMVTDANLSERRRADLESKNGELSRLYDRLKEYDDLKTRLFANVSHELRTPLTLILSPVDRMLASHPEDSALHGDLITVRRNASTLLRHVNDLLDVARMESGELEVRYAQADLGGLVSDAAAGFRSLAADHGIQLIVEAPQSLPAEVDAEKVRRILSNLLSNAFKFTPDGGRIRCAVRTTDTADRAEIEVSDSGPGVPDALREAIFERFRQGDAEPAHAIAGTGLGLAIVQEFVRLHGGSVAVSQASEGGASFRVILPLHAPAGVMVAASAPSARLRPSSAEFPRDLPVLPVSASPAWEGNEALVLVVEDNPDLNRFLVQTLSQNYRVESAADGEEGLRKARELAPDLVISDVMMPRMDGETLVRELRSDEAGRNIPVLMLTARADDELRTRMLREGAQDYLAKPISTEELRARAGNLVTMKRTRDLLQSEVSAQRGDLEELAREIAARNRELQAALESMRAARDQAVASSKVKTDFLRLVSHELRTPLTAINLQLEILLRHRLADIPEREQRNLRRICHATDRLRDLIESLLEHARLESGRLVIAREEIDVTKLVGEVIEDARPAAERKSLALTLTAPDDLPPLASDPRLVRLIVSNLVDNAVKFTDAGSVDVVITSGSDGYRVTVRDTGPGIPPSQRNRIFQPFEHLEPVEHKHTPGIGLGLALVSEIADALGGRIDLESTPGDGSAFTVTLPPS